MHPQHQALATWQTQFLDFQQTTDCRRLSVCQNTQHHVLFTEVIHYKQCKPILRRHINSVVES